MQRVLRFLFLAIAFLYGCVALAAVILVIIALLTRWLIVSNFIYVGLIYILLVALYAFLFSHIICYQLDKGEIFLNKILRTFVAFTPFHIILVDYHDHGVIISVLCVIPLLVLQLVVLSIAGDVKADIDDTIGQLRDGFYPPFDRIEEQLSSNFNALYFNIETSCQGK